MTSNTLIELCILRRRLSDRLPNYTMRNDPRVHAIQHLDVCIDILVEEAGLTIHDAYKMAGLL